MARKYLNAYSAAVNFLHNPLLVFSQQLHATKALHVHDTQFQLLVRHSIPAFVALGPVGEDNANKEKIETNVAVVASICWLINYLLQLFKTI